MVGVQKRKIEGVICILLTMLWFSSLPVQAQNGSGPVEPNFAAYYERWEFAFEPNTISYELPLDPNIITNYDHVNKILDLDQAKELISQNGFFVIEHDFGFFTDHDDIVSPYRYLREDNITLFVTSDTLLHLYHIQFDETLKEIEERQFYDDILKLTDTLLADAIQLYDELDGDLKEAARRNAAYLSVAGQLIDSSSPVPGIVSDEVSGELNKIENHSGFLPSDIFIYKEDYSQYVPRGHYTRSEKLRKYFRTLMWYGRMAFLLKGHEKWGQLGEAFINPYNAKIQTLQACLLAVSLNTQQVDERLAREIWDRIYTVTAFYVGLSDDLTPYDYLWALERVFGQEYILTELDDPNHFLELKAELALLPAPKIFGGTGDPNVLPPVTEETLKEILDKTKGMRLMGQRFVPDSYMFQNLVFSQVTDYTGDLNNLPFTSIITPISIVRGYPRGLDVMALLGSEQAMDILIQEGDTDYIGYWEKFNELADEFGVFGPEEWNRNLYWGWLYSLQALITYYGDGYPVFMQSPAWSKRCLNAALASWTELRHDTILYAKQSYSVNPPFAESSPPTPPAYVEPAPEFFGRLLALAKMTRTGLNDMEVLSEQAVERLLSFEEMLNRLIGIVTKQLTNQALSNQDRLYLNNLADDLEWVVTGIFETGLKTTMVADVHTVGSEESVLEEGVGNVDLVVVACPRPDGSAFLAVGPVLSYYEFKHPMDDRLTDEKWRVLLDSPERPERPAWYRPLMR